MKEMIKKKETNKKIGIKIENQTKLNQTLKDMIKNNNENDLKNSNKKIRIRLDKKNLIRFND
jgi:hypothetical protein